jgi:hypothetical protein
VHYHKTLFSNVFSYVRPYTTEPVSIKLHGTWEAILVKKNLSPLTRSIIQGAEYIFGYYCPKISYQYFIIVIHCLIKI